MIDDLFRAAARGIEWRDSDQAVADIVARAREKMGITSDELRNYARQHCNEIGARMAVGICQIAGPPGETDSIEIVGMIAKTDIRQAVELSTQFGSGMKFSAVLRRILETIDPSAEDVHARLGVIVSQYGDMTDLRLVTDTIKTWILTHRRELDHGKLLEFCMDEAWGTEIAEVAWSGLWEARNATTTRDAADLLGIAPNGPPPAVIDQVCLDLVRSRVPVSALAEFVNDQEPNVMVASSATRAMFSSQDYLRANLKEVAALLGSGNINITAHEIATSVFEMPAGLRDEFISCLGKDRGDPVLAQMALVYHQRGNAAEVAKCVSLIGDSRLRNELLESMHEKSR